MSAFSNLIITIAVTAIVRALAGIISPDSGMKNITDLAINAIVFSCLVSAVISLVSSFLG